MRAKRAVGLAKTVYEDASLVPGPFLQAARSQMIKNHSGRTDRQQGWGAPQPQGIMGGDDAQADGGSADVVQALYQP